MSIYVDSASIPYGRMKMCHLMADSHEELTDMATTLGLSAHIQHAGQPGEHLDVSLSKRRQAIKLGALPVRSRDLVEVVRAKRLK